MLTRRAAARCFATGAVSATIMGAGFGSARAADKEIKIGITLPLTGTQAQGASLIRGGALLAIEAANAAGTLKGFRLVPVVLNNATSTAGQYDPAQAATNARKLIADPEVLAMIGPMDSGSGKAMAPILSEAGLATITPSSTNPDLTNPKFAAEFDPSGKPIYFRTVTTDSYQGPAMTNYYSDTLGVKSVYLLDDASAYGVGIVDTFQGRARQKAMPILGRDRLDPMQADYRVTLNKIKALNPDGLYYGGDMGAGAKLIKQAYEILPAKMPKGGGDGLLQPEMFTAVGFPACAGWYCTTATPHLTQNPKVQPFVERFNATFHTLPDDYSVTSYDCALIIIGAIKELLDQGKPLTRASLRDAIQDSATDTLQGRVQFDRYGDLKSHVVSIYQVVKNTRYPLNDIIHQFKYIGVAPTS